jgi:group II intron reverse transcriptase/maturase
MRRRGLFLKAYAKIYANAGATTVGTDPEDTIQGMSLARIDAIIDQLREGTYQWKPSRRVYIPKHDGSQRPLCVPGWSDKLVQEVMRMILDAYYEPLFRDSSHGFRPNRGCHTALLAIKRGWTGTRWFIEGDIRGCFDNLDHDVLVAILKWNIHDNRFIKLVKDMLKAGYIDDWQYHRTFSGSPQGGIVSPVLSNVVLNKLDSYVEDELIPKYTHGKWRRTNPEYARVGREKRRAQESGEPDLYRELDKRHRSLPAGDPYDPNFRRLKYLRYADDWVLGFIGPKEEAQTIKAEVGGYLKTLRLTMSEEKTTITHAGTQPARFLGYDIKVAWCDTKMARSRTDGVKYRSVNGVIQLYVPREVQIRWKHGYTQKSKVRSVWAYRELSDYEIVETFGAQLRGLVNFYSLATNVGNGLRAVRWAGMETARKTLAAKHKFRSPAASYRRYYHRNTGPDEWNHLRVTVQREGKSPLIAKCGETPLRTRKTTYIRDVVPPAVIAGTKSELLTRLLKGECELCGEQDALEAHHVNKLKNLRKRWQGKREKPVWVQHMLARRRKTLVVCHDCHVAITHGRYDGQRVN